MSRRVGKMSKKGRAGQKRKPVKKGLLTIEEELKKVVEETDWVEVHRDFCRQVFLERQELERKADEEWRKRREEGKVCLCPNCLPLFRSFGNAA